MLCPILSTSFTVTLNTTTILTCLAVTVFLLSWIIRYRYLNRYTRLPIEPPRKEQPLDLYPPAPEPDVKPGFSNYLDEFLSAIKVFGYLERPVFHELTRTMQTRKLVAGETLLLEEEKGFCLVVDGLVQIFVKSHRPMDGDVAEDECDGETRRQGYQLLTEVRNGAPMSSLFSILSLFTEDISLRGDTSSRPSSSHLFSMTPVSKTESPVARPADPIPPLSLDAAKAASLSAHPDILARAVRDTTIAIIPASAFRRLTRTYPKATAHIVQVILTRLQRVTLGTAQTYLGLGAEILRTERLMADYTTVELPNHLRGQKLDELRQRYGCEASLQNTAGRHTVNAGDLLHPRSSFNRPSPTQGSWERPSFIHAGRDMEPSESRHDESIAYDHSDKPEPDTIIRDSVSRCVLKAVGLEEGRDSLHRRLRSVEQSPRMLSYDAAKQKATFFGFVESLETSTDGESESAISQTPIHTYNSALIHVQRELEIVHLDKHVCLVKHGERNPGLYYVIDGFLEVDDVVLVKPGGLAGYMGTLSSYRSLVNVRTKSDVYLGFLRRSAVELLVERHPTILLALAKRLTSLLPRLILQLDFALEWVQIPAGHVIHRQGDESDAIYIVLNGRLRSVSKKLETQEHSQGDSVGELEVMTESPRPMTLHAVRDTELAKFPKTLFNCLAMEHPGITIKVSRIIAQRMQPTTVLPVSSKTVALLPVDAGIPIVEFGNRLLTALSQLDLPNGVLVLNQATILSHLGRHAFSRMGKLKLSQYLADLEEQYGMLLYVADTSARSTWTQTCVSQADCILLVGSGQEAPALGEYERLLMKTTAKKELILLHADRYLNPGTTRAWLRNRTWINGTHHHIQMGVRHSPVKHHRRFGIAIRQRLQAYTSRRIRPSATGNGDFPRLARRLCGRSIGLVLGGGGARGIAQVGVIRAIEEAGIPVDIVGGTSIGAFVGALYARDADVVSMYGRVKKFAGRMGSMWRFALDLTYPSASYTTGHEFNRGIYKTFGNSQMEDFWLEFYCNTTNLSKSRMEYHSSGYVWRYVRASMSLAGLIPPLCDEGSMLLDGGYMDNLTVSHMKSRGAQLILAIDVGAVDDTEPQAFGDTLSGIWSLINRWNPFSEHPNPPTLSEIQARLAYVSSVDALERAKTTEGCIYMRPPIDEYGTLDFGRFDEIYNCGYAYGKRFLAQAQREGQLDCLKAMQVADKSKDVRNHANSESECRPTIRRASI